MVDIDSEIREDCRHYIHRSIDQCIWLNPCIRKSVNDLEELELARDIIQFLFNLFSPRNLTIGNLNSEKAYLGKVPQLKAITHRTTGHMGLIRESGISEILRKGDTFDPSLATTKKFLARGVIEVKIFSVTRLVVDHNPGSLNESALAFKVLSMSFCNCGIGSVTFAKLLKVGTAKGFQFLR